tara:strand:- start:373 stop:1002 length:630 start_codon:yes stop_codon:yes gene_type:complete
MSQIKLKHSGGNGVIIAAPSSNPAADRTLLLPSNADSTIDTLDREGNILQVKQTVKTDTFSQSMSAGGITGAVMSLNFTPVKADSKLLIHVSANVGTSGVSGIPRTGISLFADGSIISGARGDTGESNQQRVASTCTGVSGSNNEYALNNLCLMYLHTVSNTNQVTYDVRLTHLDGDSADVLLNRMHNNSNAVFAPRAMSTITIQEVAV